MSWGVDDDGLKSSKSVQMFAHQLFGSDATVVDSCIMIATALGVAVVPPPPAAAAAHIPGA